MGRFQLFAMRTFFCVKNGRYILPKDLLCEHWYALNSGKTFIWNFVTMNILNLSQNLQIARTMRISKSKPH